MDVESKFLVSANLIQSFPGKSKHSFLPRTTSTGLGETTNNSKHIDSIARNVIQLGLHYSCFTSIIKIKVHFL